MFTLWRIKLHQFFNYLFPEKRVYLRTDIDTRFVRLGAGKQILIWLTAALFLGWSIFASAILIINMIGSGNQGLQDRTHQYIYEERLNKLANERDARTQEAIEAQSRFHSVLAQISAMQSELLDLEKQRRELQDGIAVLQVALGHSTEERNAAMDELDKLVNQPGSSALAAHSGNKSDDIYFTLEYMTQALADAADARDIAIIDANESRENLKTAHLQLQKLEERNMQIFRQLDDALTISVAPLTRMFRNAGLNPDKLIETVRRGYSGQGGLEPLSFSSAADHAYDPVLDPHTDHANAILNRLDELNIYRIAADQAPLSKPVTNNFRYTSGFGKRWGRDHNGLDLAAPYGTPILTTADGVITKAGWASGYGRVVYIKHANGIETRYAHLAKIRVKKGQKVSRGDRIGDMGNSGKSTGTHLHYEIRVNGKPINPMNYIKAAKHVL